MHPHPAGADTDRLFAQPIGNAREHGQSLYTPAGRDPRGSFWRRSQVNTRARYRRGGMYAYATKTITASPANANVIPGDYR